MVKFKIMDLHFWLEIFFLVGFGGVMDIVSIQMFGDAVFFVQDMAFVFRVTAFPSAILFAILKMSSGYDAQLPLL